MTGRGRWSRRNKAHLEARRHNGRKLWATVCTILAGISRDLKECNGLEKLCWAP